MGVKAKSFDMEIKKKEGGFSASFLGIDKNEHEMIEIYFASKNVSMVVIQESVQKYSQDEYEEEGDESNKKEA